MSTAWSEYEEARTLPAWRQRLRSRMQEDARAADATTRIRGRHMTPEERDRLHARLIELKAEGYSAWNAFMHLGPDFEGTGYKAVRSCWPGEP